MDMIIEVAVERLQKLVAKLPQKDEAMAMELIDYIVKNANKKSSKGKHC